MVCSDCGVDLELVPDGAVGAAGMEPPYSGADPIAVSDSPEPLTFVGLALERPARSPVASQSDITVESDITTGAPTAPSFSPTLSPPVTGRTFRYRARQQDGRTVNGEVDAASQEAAIAELRSRGLWISEVKEQRGPGASSGRSENPVRTLGSGVPLRARAYFFRQLALLIKTGIAPAESLRLLEGQTSNPRLKAIALETSAQCARGGKVSEVFRRYPGIFPEAVLEMVAAGEESGRMDRFLARIADYMDRLCEIASRVQSALVYPIAVVLTIIFVPKAVVLFTGGIVPYLLATGPWACLVLGVVFAFVGFFRFVNSTSGGSYKLDQIKLSLPVIGKITRQLAMGKFGRTLAMLYEAGVPLARSLTVAANACGNRHLRAKLLETVPAVQSGELLSRALARTGCFPATLTHEVATGESTGNLDQMVNRMAEYAESDANAAIDQAITLLLPACILVLAIIVLKICVDFYGSQFHI